MNRKCLAWAGVGLFVVVAGCSSRRGSGGDSTQIESQSLTSSQVSSVEPQVQFTVAERGPHHRAIQKVITMTNVEGRLVQRTNQGFVELATGLHYIEGGQLRESRAEIESSPEGAVARQGQHKVTFGYDIATPGAIDLETPDGKRLRSHVVGLSYFDLATGSNVLIAEIRPAPGQIDPPNQVIYENAFTDFRVDVRYTYRIGGFEQDIILRERPPSPQEFGLDPSSVTLQVWTEFFAPPGPGIETHDLGIAPGLVDQKLDFGIMKMGRSRAFKIGEESEWPGIPMAKRWVSTEGRNFLIEEVLLSAIAPELETLPPPAGAMNQRFDSSKFASLRHAPPPARGPPLDIMIGTEMAKIDYPTPREGFDL